MQSFQERFRTKSSIVGRTGELEVNPDRVISRPLQQQLHSPIIKSSAKSIIDSSPQKYFSNTPSKIPNSASPNKKTISPKRQASQAPPFSLIGKLEEPLSLTNRMIEYKPYTIKDYYNIKPTKYYELGGLGSPTIGTEDWGKRKNISDKRKEYGKKAMKMPREHTLTDNAIEYLEKIKSHSVAHTRHSSAYN
ncbi:hypothetical protein SteCoe_18557 [Stentor coeruleus]|uniref:Uncharacterized protein n=1 Tax=Stentor coeruleus TaxID=5963 RepID=A0A1R2BWH4_9CILI|nr:hypothetical protein SteCoe_18557 [Stentor coeruleus]